MDDADRAAELEERIRAAALAAARFSRRQSRVSRCRDCMTDLGDQRIALGADRCVECQIEHDYVTRRHKGR